MKSDGSIDRRPLRFRRDLGQPVNSPDWPTGFCCRVLLPNDVPAIHDLLRLDDMHGLDLPDQGNWWETLAGDSEFDPDLCFLVVEPRGRIAGIALSWTSAFLKDLVVHPDFRRQGLGKNLLRQLFRTFRDRGEPHVDLKVEAGNVPAIRLYERVGMRQVPLEGLEAQAARCRSRCASARISKDRSRAS